METVESLPNDEVIEEAEKLERLAEALGLSLELLVASLFTSN